MLSARQTMEQSGVEWIGVGWGGVVAVTSSATKAKNTSHHTNPDRNWLRCCREKGARGRHELSLQIVRLFLRT